MAKEGMEAILSWNNVKVKIEFVCKNAFIGYSHAKLPCGTDGGATIDEGLKGINGEIIKHPSYFEKLN